jgi:hypothetical protein
MKELKSFKNCYIWLWLATGFIVIAPGLSKAKNLHETLMAALIAGMIWFIFWVASIERLIRLGKAAKLHSPTVNGILGAVLWFVWPFIVMNEAKDFIKAHGLESRTQ